MGIDRGIRRGRGEGGEGRREGEVEEWRCK